MGLYVQYHNTVGDNVNAIANIIQTAYERSKFIIVTGGLGPTADDLTRAALAQATDQPLVENRAALQHIISLFEQRGREMAPNNRIQAMLPKTAVVIHNAEGTAPGVDIIVSSHKNKPRVFCLPGVPAEMKLMFDSHVLPNIQQDIPGTPQITQHYVLKTFGMGESNLEHQLPEFFQRDRRPVVGITASDATITLRIQTTAETAEECDALAQPTLDQLTDKLGDVVFANHEVKLGVKVCQRLSENGESVATWECATQGQLATMLHAPLHPVLTASRYALVMDELSFEEDGLANKASNFRKETGATYAIVVGPVRPPHQTGATVPQFNVAIAYENGSDVQTHDFTGHPDILLAKAAKQAINQLRLYMQTTE
jgi:nicotinamide-nucleotide amidase